jgi:hypothetical protein
MVSHTLADSCISMLQYEEARFLARSRIPEAFKVE